MKATWTGFLSPLAGQIECYLATKRALGCRFLSEDRTLRLFDRFLVEADITTVEQITPETIERFLASDHGACRKAITICSASSGDSRTGS